MGMKRSQDTVQEQDVWSTTEIGDLGMGLWLKKEGIKTGDASLDDLMKAQMEQIRGEKGLGRILDHSNLHPGEPNAMTAKFRIADLLGIRVNSVERFKAMAGI